MLIRAQQASSGLAGPNEPLAALAEESYEVSLPSVPAGEPLDTGDPRIVRGPEKFGRYVLLERMARGGMADVFRAVVPGAEGFRRQVVLKRILAGHASAPAFVDMFVQEARISALLHHPNIVQVFDFGQVDGSYFLAMELLDGWEVGAINKALRETHAKMPIEVAVHIAHEVSLGLSYAHTLKVQGYQPHIVHRDVSPSNIMCLRAGGVKLLDFGVASATGAAESSQADRQAFCGKLSYSAPEYVRGRGHDARIDLFALGVVLWEMLAGERLFRGKTDRETLASLLGAPIAAPSTKRPAVPAEIDRIVLKALERDPDRRYQSAAHMAQDLEQVLGDRRYQSQALPRLLSNLFGQTASNATAVTAVEEIIQSGSMIPPSTVSTRSRRSRLTGRAAKFLRSGPAAFLMLVGATAGMFGAVFIASHRTVSPRIIIAAPRPTPVMPEIHPFTVPAIQPLPVLIAMPPDATPLPPVPGFDAPAVTHAASGGVAAAVDRDWTLALPTTKKITRRKPRATSAIAPTTSSASINKRSAGERSAQAASRRGRK